MAPVIRNSTPRRGPSAGSRGAAERPRFLWSAILALLAHAALLPLAWQRQPNPRGPSEPVATLAVELVYVAPLAEPERITVEPLPERASVPDVSSAPAPASAALAARKRVPERQPAPAAQQAAVLEGADLAGPTLSPGEAGPLPSASAGGTGSAEGSAPKIDLGLSGSVGRWAFEAEQRKRSERKADVGGLQQGLLDSDTELGRGPGSEIAAYVLRHGRGLAPLGSTATADFTIEADGRVASATLVDTHSEGAAWQRFLDTLLPRLPRLSAAPARRLRARLFMESRSAKPSGSSASLFEFDVSNIGAAQQHWFHVRVVAQLAD